MKVVGSVGAYVSKTVTFTVTIVNGCGSVTITPITIPSLTYTVGNSIETYTFTTWYEASGVCGLFTYSSTYTSGLSLGSFITFISTTRTYSIYSADITQAGFYNIQTRGTLQNGHYATSNF